MSAALLKQFGLNLQALREARELPLHKFARLIGYQRHWIAALEAGCVNVSLETVDKLARGLGCDPSELLKPSKIEAELTPEQQAEYARAAGLPPGDL
jgi:transcriptional regulator with XRE-family HTH domain